MIYSDVSEVGITGRSLIAKCRLVVALLCFVIVSFWLSAALALGDEPRSVPRPVMRSASEMREFAMLLRHPTARWIQVEDNELSSTLSLDSLLLSSSLVAHVKVIKTVSNYNSGPIRNDLKLVRILETFRTAYGPDQYTTAGKDIVVVDKVDVSGLEFLDDLSLGPSDNALVFLERLPSKYKLNVQGTVFPVYRFAAPFISKYEINGDGSLTAMSVRDSRTRRQLNGAMLRTFFGTVSPGSSRADGGRRVIDALARRGMQAPSSLGSYLRLLNEEPWKLRRLLAARDEQDVWQHPALFPR